MTSLAVVLVLAAGFVLGAFAVALAVLAWLTRLARAVSAADQLSKEGGSRV